MNEIYTDANDEQLALLIFEGDIPAYYELFLRCKRYANIPAAELQKQYKTAIYDEGEFNRVLTESFEAMLDSFDFSTSLLNNYFINIFRHLYARELKERSEEEAIMYSLDDYLTPYSELKYQDILSDKRDYFKEYFDIVSSREILSRLKTPSVLSPNAKAIVLYRCRGYSYKEIAKIMKLTVKKVRYILGHPALKLAIKRLVESITKNIIAPY